MESSAILERSTDPGIRESIRPRRSSLHGRPIVCFAAVGCIMLILGLGMVVWESLKRPKLELDNFYHIIRTLGSTFLSLGLFVFLSSTLLICESAIGERKRSREQLDFLSDDFQPSQEYGSSWDTKRLHDDFASKRTRSLIFDEKPNSRMVRCFSDSHFGDQTRPPVSHPSGVKQWDSYEHFDDGDRADLLRSSASSVTSNHARYNWTTSHKTVSYLSDGPVEVHTRFKHRRKNKWRKREAEYERLNRSGEFPERKILDRPRLRVSLSEEAFEEQSSVDSPDSGHPEPDIPVKRSNAELLSILVEKGILKLEDFQHFFALTNAGQEPKRPETARSYHDVHSPTFRIEQEVTKTSHFEHFHKSVRSPEIPKPISRKLVKELAYPRKTGAQSMGLLPPIQDHAASRVLFTIGEQTRSSSSEWECVENENGAYGGSTNAETTSCLSRSFPEDQQRPYESFHSRSSQSYFPDTSKPEKAEESILLDVEAVGSEPQIITEHYEYDANGVLTGLSINAEENDNISLVPDSEQREAEGVVLDESQQKIVDVKTSNTFRNN